jgi:hypothetical protein
MNYGKINIVAGFIGLILAVCGGMVLGLTFDRFAVQDGNHVLSIVRFYLREGHSHGMPISFFNLFIGLLLDRMVLSNGLKKACSILTLFAYFLPIGLVLKGAAGAPSNFPPIGMIGVFAVLGTVIIMLTGALRIQRSGNNIKSK